MAGWPRRKARIDKSRLKGIPGSTSSASRFRNAHRGFHPLLPTGRNSASDEKHGREASPKSLPITTSRGPILTGPDSFRNYRRYHQSSETVSPSMGSGHWPGMRYTPVPPVPFLRKSSGKSDRRPADSAGVNGPTEGRISGRAAATSSRNLTAPRLGAPIWQVQLNLPLVCLDPRSGRYLGRKATYPSWVGLRYNDLDPERSIAQRYDAVDRLSVRMQPGHVLSGHHAHGHQRVSNAPEAQSLRWARRRPCASLLPSRPDRHRVPSPSRQPCSGTSPQFSWFLRSLDSRPTHIRC
jgi:hypothetical protein